MSERVLPLTPHAFPVRRKMIALRLKERRHDGRRYCSWARLPRAIPWLSSHACAIHRLHRRLIVHECHLDLASEDAVADDRVEQHQWEDDHTSPEHERKTG